MASVVTDSAGIPAPGSQHGRFVAIEMAGAAGQRAGLGGRWVPVAEAQAVLETFLADFIARASAEEKGAAKAKAERVEVVGEGAGGGKGKGGGKGGAVQAAEKKQGRPRGKAKRDWRSVVPGTGCVMALHLLSVLDPAAKVLFAREFELGEGDHRRALKPSWTLGMYVQWLRQRQAQQQAQEEAGPAGGGLSDRGFLARKFPGLFGGLPSSKDVLGPMVEEARGAFSVGK